MGIELHQIVLFLSGQMALLGAVTLTKLGARVWPSPQAPDNRRSHSRGGDFFGGRRAEHGENNRMRRLIEGTARTFGLTIRSPGSRVPYGSEPFILAAGGDPLFFDQKA